MNKDEMLQLLDEVENRIKNENKGTIWRAERLKLNFIRSMVKSGECESLTKMICYLVYTGSVDDQLRKGGQ